MQNTTFVDLLSDIRRKSQITGRPMTKQETAGAVAGYAEDANTRLARGRQLDLQEKEVALNYTQRNKEMRAQERAADKAQSQKKTSSALTGAVAGGYLLGGPLGFVIGGALGFLGGDCIIVTACTNRDSYEVEITRLYRDNHMDIHELIGYYGIAHYIVPIIKRFKPFKWLTKKILVDHLIDYGEWFMGLKTEMKHPFVSKHITLKFLKLCEKYGLFLNRLLIKRLNYG